MKLFSELLNFEEKILSAAFGNFGKSLYKFSKDLDQNHFGICDIPIDDELSNKFIQILNFVKLGFDNNLNEAIEGISKFYKKNIPIELENIDKKFVRLIKDEEKREYLRSSKKVCEISLIKFYEKARVIWENTPDDFDLFLKYSTCYDQMVNEAEIKADRYRQLGCDELYNNIIASVEYMKQQMNDTYRGYHRISLRNAAIILAKINQFKLLFNSIDKPSICLNKHVYRPKLYPIKHLRHIQTDCMSNLILDLEKIPLFDYYMVLVASHDKANQDSDIESIKNKSTIPILIGEKDGKCYFISYWI